MIEEEWGPWIYHTPGPPPSCLEVGMWAEFKILFRPNFVESGEGRVTPAVLDAVYWVSDGSGEYARVLCFRIRKPKALKKLEKLVASLPEEVDA